MPNNSEVDDVDDTAQTLRPPIRFSQKPTPLLPPKSIKQHPPMKYKFHLIGIIIIVVIITAIICITTPLQSHSIQEHIIYNLSPIIIPIEQKPEIKTIEVITPIISAKPIEKIIPPIKKIEIKKPQDKDYGI